MSNVLIETINASSSLPRQADDNGLVVVKLNPLSTNPTNLFELFECVRPFCRLALKVLRRNWNIEVRYILDQSNQGL